MCNKFFIYILTTKQLQIFHNLNFSPCFLSLQFKRFMFRFICSIILYVFFAFSNIMLNLSLPKCLIYLIYFVVTTKMEIYMHLYVLIIIYYNSIKFIFQHFCLNNVLSTIYNWYDITYGSVYSYEFNPKHDNNSHRLILFCM